MSNFKAGDKVYYLGAKPQIYILEDDIDNAMYPLAIEDTLFRATFTRMGLSYITDSLPSIFHATEENRRKLSELYGVEFETPPVKPTSREIIKAKLDSEKLPVPYKEISFKHIINAISDGKIVEVEKFDQMGNPVWATISGIISINELNQLKDNRFRQAIPTINIGGYSVPKPLTEAPDEDLEMYIPNVLNYLLYFSSRWNSESLAHQKWLKLGMIHSTKEAAIAHAKALIAISGGAIQEEVDNGTNE